MLTLLYVFLITALQQYPLCATCILLVCLSIAVSTLMWTTLCTLAFPVVGCRWVHHCPIRNTTLCTGRITSVISIAYLSVLSCCVQLGSQGLSIALNQKETNCAQQWLPVENSWISFSVLKYSLVSSEVIHQVVVCSRHSYSVGTLQWTTWSP